VQARDGSGGNKALVLLLINERASAAWRGLEARCWRNSCLAEIQIYRETSRKMALREDRY